MAGISLDPNPIEPVVALAQVIGQDLLENTHISYAPANYFRHIINE
jgi:hypothetical protein